MILRLLCLASVVNGGIKNKVLENLKREILQVGRSLVMVNIAPRLLISLKTYGYEYLPLILSLSSPPLGLILPIPLPSSSTSLSALKIPYSSLRKSLRLITEEEHEVPDEPTDVSYVYSGYAPLSVRLVQCVVQKGGVLGVSGSSDGGDAARKGKSPGLSKVRAHPILGWKGFEDVLESLPGETIDVVQTGQVARGSDTSHSVPTGLGESLQCC